MISICIPVYNFSIAELVEALRKQADKIDVAVEIIIIDDASDPIFRQQNKRVEKLVDQYIELSSNIGRSRIRNLFLKYIKHPYCLFLDCDVIPAGSNFLSEYSNHLHQSPSVIYGGRIFPEEAPVAEKRLRWKYGTEIESRSATKRQTDPYRNFHSNNFLISTTIFKNINFDESLILYGYEDSLLSYQLQTAGIKILHIDNPVLNLHIETTENFLKNIDDSLENLAAIQRKHDISKIVRLVKNSNQYKRLLAFTPAGTREMIRTKLLNGSLNLRLLQFYKLISYQAAIKKVNG